MHLLIVSLMCYVFVLTGMHAGVAESTEDAKLYKCGANVPPTAKKALLDAINGKRINSSINPLPSTESFDCDLAQEAFTNTFKDKSHQGFKIESAFGDNWQEALKNELLSSSTTGMIYAANSVGCGIRLETSQTDGLHKIKVECALDNQPPRPPR
uniref:DUF3718 domain-containing protein n=1 Tax=Haemonchus contortus TaxID=6289 RepID=A0A7I5E6E8_HAECO|nr:unnamed protein product [Haemonchus contortus]